MQQTSWSSEGSGVLSPGIVLLGRVEGDVHEIGKSIVGIVLAADGFEGRVMVGGAALTHESAGAIGADAFAADAWQALRRVRALTGRPVA